MQHFNCDIGLHNFRQLYVAKMITSNFYDFRYTHKYHRNGDCNIVDITKLKPLC